jgi:hypothetical protein
VLVEAVCAALTGFTLGLFVPHWIGVVIISFVMSTAFFTTTPWDSLTIPKWIGLLTVLQVAYLAGVACTIRR